MSKFIGRRSSAQDNFIGPESATNLTATNVGTNRPFNDGRIDLSWTNPSQGNTPVGYKIIRNGSEIATVSHPTNTYSSTSLLSSTSYSYQVVAYDNFKDAAPSNSASATATTVPAAPSAPSASSPSAGVDSVSWSEPANGGSAITNYYWESDDGKSGNTGTSTSVSVNQEQGTAQSYRVYATNANGNSSFSSYSGSVTTTFSFTPFSFAPFGFTPFGFTPFGFTPFGFTPFGFTPFGFTPFGFTPFGFTPFGFQKSYKSVSANTLVKTTTGYVPAISLKVGDTLVAADILDNDTGNTLNQFQYGWSTSSATVDATKETTIQGLTAYFVDSIYLINNVKYSDTHFILIKRPGMLNGENNTEDGNDMISFLNVQDIVETDLLWSSALQEFVSISGIQIVEQRELVICIDVEPYDVFFVDNDILVHDSQPLEHIKQYVVSNPGEDLSEALLELYQSVVNEEQAIQAAIDAVVKAEQSMLVEDLTSARIKVMLLQGSAGNLVPNDDDTKAGLIQRLNTLETQINAQ